MSYKYSKTISIRYCNKINVDHASISDGVREDSKQQDTILCE